MSVGIGFTVTGGPTLEEIRDHLPLVFTLAESCHDLVIDVITSLERGQHHDWWEVKAEADFPTGHSGVRLTRRYEVTITYNTRRKAGYGRMKQIVKEASPI